MKCKRIYLYYKANRRNNYLHKRPLIRGINKSFLLNIRSECFFIAKIFESTSLFDSREYF
jgi:hypothetical protein